MAVKGKRRYVTVNPPADIMDRVIGKFPSFGKQRKKVR